MPWRNGRGRRAGGEWGQDEFHDKAPAIVCPGLALETTTGVLQHEELNSYGYRLYVDFVVIPCCCLVLNFALSLSFFTSRVGGKKNGTEACWLKIPPINTDTRTLNNN